MLGRQREEEEGLSLIRNVSTEHLGPADAHGISESDVDEKVNASDATASTVPYPQFCEKLFLSFRCTLHSLHDGLPNNYRLSTSRAVAIALYIAIALLPSFVQSRLRPSTSASKPPHPTAFLDGMRGVAAILVVFCHLSLSHFDIKFGYGALGMDQYRHWLRLPIIRLIYTGQPMVCIFFVVSGYALSYKPLKLMRSRHPGHLAELFTSLSSSAFRRAFRLFLPVIASTFLIMNMSYFGIFAIATDITYGKIGPFHRRDSLLRLPTFNAQLSNWLLVTFNFIDPFLWDFSRNDYDDHLWTIADEFRASLLLFLTLLGVGRMRPVARMLTLGLLILYCAGKGRWQIILFYAGTILAEWDMMRTMKATPEQSHILLPTTQSLITRNSRLSLLKNISSILAVFIGLFLCSQPQRAGDTTPGWVFLSSIEPASFNDPQHPAKQHFWPSIGAFMLIATTSHNDRLKRVFDNAPVRYLGRISFAVYLCHGIVLRTAGSIAFGTSKRIFNGSVPAAFFMSNVTSYFVLIWMADVFTRLVDVPSVTFAKWLEDKLRWRDEQ